MIYLFTLVPSLWLFAIQRVDGTADPQGAHNEIFCNGDIGHD